MSSTAQRIDAFRREITKTLVEEDSTRAALDKAVALYTADASAASARIEAATAEQTRALHSERIAYDLHKFLVDTVGYHVAVAATLHATVRDLSDQLERIGWLIQQTDEGQHVPREDLVEILGTQGRAHRFETRLVAFASDRRHTLGVFEAEDGTIQARPFLGWGSVVCGPEGGHTMEAVFLDDHQACSASAMAESRHLRLREIR